MRTMLISLALIGSLTHLVVTQLPPATTPINIIDRKCGTVYKCYAPEQCKGSTVTDIASGGVIELSAAPTDTELLINDNCPALIRFHLYTEYKLHIEIESFQGKDDVNSIVLFQRDKNNVHTKNTFSCEILNNKMEGKHGSILKFKTGNLPQKLHCVFDIIKNKNLNIKMFNSAAGDKATIKVNNVESKPITLLFRDDANCDPNQFKFNRDPDPKKLIKPISYEPGKYYCKEKNYELELRVDKNSEYVPVKQKVKCISAEGKFEIDGQQLPGEDVAIDIRCFINVEYLCTDEPKWTGEKIKPIFDKPSFALKTPASLKCPDKHPHFVIAGDSGKGIKKQIPEKKAKFECKPFGGEQLWVVDKEIVTKKGPNVYCTDELQCHLMGFKILESSVDQGYVNSDRVPQCYDQGTLKLKMNNKPVNVSCDLKSGNYTYTFVGEAGEPHVVVADTKFTCDYPVIKDEAANKANEQKIANGVIAAGGCAVAVLVVAITMCVFLLKRNVAKKKRDAKKAELEAKEDFYKYVADDDEIKEEKAAKKAQEKLKIQNMKEEMMSKRERKANWNESVTHMMAVGMSLSRNEKPNGHIASTEAKKSTMSLDEWVERKKKEGMGVPLMTKVRKLDKSKKKRMAQGRDFDCPTLIDYRKHVIKNMAELTVKRKNHQRARRAKSYHSDEKYRNIPMNTPKKG